MNADSVIKFLDDGGSITSEELRKYLHEIEKEAGEKAADSLRRFLSEKAKQLRNKKKQRLEKEFHEIVADTADYLYKMRRIRNGQDLEISGSEGNAGVPGEELRGSSPGKVDKRFRGEEKISV